MFLWDNNKQDIIIPASPGSALVLILLVMSIVLAYSVHALQSSRCLRTFAYNRTQWVNQQRHITLAYRYAYIFCKQYHEQLCKENQPITILITPEQTASMYQMHLTITPSGDSYTVIASIKKGECAIATSEKTIPYQTFTVTQL